MSTPATFKNQTDQIFSYQLIHRNHSGKYHLWRYQHRNLGERSCHRSPSESISCVNTSYLQKPDQIFSYQLIHRIHSGKYHHWRYKHRKLGERSCHRSPSESSSSVNTSYLQKPDQIFSYQLIQRIHSDKYHHWRYQHRNLGRTKLPSFFIGRYFQCQHQLPSKTRPNILVSTNSQKSFG